MKLPRFFLSHSWLDLRFYSVRICRFEVLLVSVLGLALSCLASSVRSWLSVFKCSALFVLYLNSAFKFISLLIFLVLSSAALLNSHLFYFTFCSHRLTLFVFLQNHPTSDNCLCSSDWFFPQILSTSLNFNFPSSCLFQFVIEFITALLNA